ncbi:MAG: cation:proton antiporter [Dehalococcoidales bacterium]
MADFAIIMGAALVGGLVAYRLRLPVLLGYLVAGILIGPFSFGLVKNVDMVQTMASIGVVLLMFTLGMEFSIGDLKRVGKIGLGGGIAQILVTALLGFAIGKTLLNWSISDAIFFGFLIALSSTMVVLKILVERGETNSPYGRIMIAILLVQDLAVVPLMIILPALGQQATGLGYSLGITMGSALLFLGVMTVIGFWVVPLVLGQTAGARSRELFLITILAICLGAAFGTSYFGVSAAFGAFAAGMLVSRSHFAHQALADIIPLRNAFAALFFVSLGMLASPRFIVDNWSMVILVALIIVVGKFVICSVIARSFGYSLKTTLFVGAGLTQVGEFSFVLGQAGLEAGVISEYLYSLILASAILTILFTPIAFKIAEWTSGWLSTSRRLAPLTQFGSDRALIDVKKRLSNHVIVCGHGRTGSNLTDILQRYNIPYIVVELNPQIISELRAQKIPCIYGDAGNARILSMAHVSKARVLALTCPDPMAEMTATTYAKEVNPDIDIVAVLPEASVGKRLQRLGVSETVEPAFEASLEFVRHTLGYYKVDAVEVEGLACPFLKRQEGTVTPEEQDED